MAINNYDDDLFLHDDDDYQAEDERPQPNEQIANPLLGYVIDDMFFRLAIDDLGIPPAENQ